jgi:hypothetical protein
MDAPTIAIALVRCSSRVASATNAVTAAEIAPAPCTARPTIEDVVGGRGDEAADGKQHEAGDDHRLASPAVAGGSERNLQQALGQAVDPERQADQGRTVAAGNRARVHGEHRQDQEQAQHAQGEDRRERGARAHFLAGHARRRAGGHA